MAVNVQAAVEAQLLGVNLVGMLSKTSATVAEKKQDTMEFLIMPSSLDENEPITVESVVYEINKTIYQIENNTSKDPGEINEPVSKEAVLAALDVVGLGEGAQLTFMQTFIHYKKVTEEGKEAPVTNITEYAIGIHIKGQDFNAEGFNFLKIKEVYINVWNTENYKVLERMKIWTPEELLIS